MNDKNSDVEAQSKIGRISVDLGDVNSLTVSQIFINLVKRLGDKTAVVFWSTILLLILWGLKGNAAVIFPAEWRSSLFPSIPWRDQLVSFGVGFILLVGIPCCIIKFYFKEKLSSYGLGWSKKKISSGMTAFLVLTLAAVPVFYSAANNPSMQAEYPQFGDSVPPGDWGGFLAYQSVHILFFVCIEFIFRGYLLFGLYGPRKENDGESAAGKPGPLVFGFYAVLIQMMAYTVWHIPKPPVEYFAALIWGTGSAVVALKMRSIWPIIIVHWLLNIFMDVMIWIQRLV
jgi:hypothetical protein